MRRNGRANIIIKENKKSHLNRVPGGRGGCGALIVIYIYVLNRGIYSMIGCLHNRPVAKPEHVPAHALDYHSVGISIRVGGLAAEIRFLKIQTRVFS